MATLRMGREVYDFDLQTINRKVSAERVGNYALGNMREREGVFEVRYVGRSDVDLNEELKATFRRRIKGQVAEKRYSRFKFDYADNVKAAHKKECQNYHDFDKGKLDNKEHPDKPDGTDYPCPHKGCDK